MKIRYRIVIYVAVGILLYFIWGAAAEKFNLVRILISSPSDIAVYVSNEWKRLLFDILHTLAVASSGLCLAVVIGFGLAFIGSSVSFLERPLIGFSSVAQTIPIIVFVPFLIILIGPGFVSKMILASLMSLFVILTNTMITLDAVKKEYSEFLNFYKITNFRRYTHVLLPAALGPIIGTVRIAAGLAILGAIVVEFTGSKYGLGKNIFLSSVRLEPELMVLSVASCVLLGVIVHLAFTTIERKYFWWRTNL